VLDVEFETYPDQNTTLVMLTDTSMHAALMMDALSNIVLDGTPALMEPSKAPPR
jgi:hypothetical protein